MPQVVYEMSADEKKAVDAFLRVQEAQKGVVRGFEVIAAKGKDSADELHASWSKLASLEAQHAEAVKKSGDNYSGFGANAKSVLLDVGKAIIGPLAALKSAEAVFEGVGNAIEGYFSRIKDKADATRASVESMQKAMMGRDMILLPDLAAQIEATPSRYLKGSQKQDVFREIRAQSQGDLSPAQEMQIFTQTMGAADDGTDPMAFAKTMTTLAKDPRAMKEFRSIAGLDNAVRNLLPVMPGGADGEAGTILNRASTVPGLSLETTLDLLKTSKGRGESGKVVSKILDVLNQNISDADLKKEMREEDDPEAQRKIAALEKENDAAKAARDGIGEKRQTLSRQRQDLDQRFKGKDAGPARAREDRRLELEDRALQDQEQALGREGDARAQQIEALRKLKVSVPTERYGPLAELKEAGGDSELKLRKILERPERFLGAVGVGEQNLITGLYRGLGETKRLRGRDLAVEAEDQAANATEIQPGDSAAIIEQKMRLKAVRERTEYERMFDSESNSAGAIMQDTNKTLRDRRNPNKPIREFLRKDMPGVRSVLQTIDSITTATSGANIVDEQMAAARKTANAIPIQDAYRGGGTVQVEIVGDRTKAQRVNMTPFGGNEKTGPREK